MKRGFWAGVAVGAAALGLSLTLVGCQGFSKTIQLPPGSDASCSVTVHEPGGGK